MKLKKPEIFNMAEKGGERGIIKQLLIFLWVFIIANLIASVPTIIYEFIAIGTGKLNPEEINAELATTAGADSRIWILLSLFGTLLASIYTIRRAIKKENRTLESFGFRGKTAFKEYVIGMILSFLMISAVVGVNILTGAMTIEIAKDALSSMTMLYIILYFLGFFFQGAFEEIIIRGYLMVNIGGKHSVATSIIISSIVFSVMHGANPGIGGIAILNLLLIAIFYALYIICFDNIWGACAMHSVWNFLQGCFYGIQVSGMEIVDTFFVCSAVPGKELINGGAFGAEGGIATSIITGLSILILLIYMKKKGKFEEKVEEKREAESK